jgi:hypothetical protein
MESSNDSDVATSALVAEHNRINKAMWRAIKQRGLDVPDERDQAQWIQMMQLRQHLTELGVPFVRIDESYGDLLPTDTWGDVVVPGLAWRMGRVPGGLASFPASVTRPITSQETVTAELRKLGITILEDGRDLELCDMLTDIVTILSAHVDPAIRIKVEWVIDAIDNILF